MAAAVFAANPWDSYAPLMAIAALLCVVGSAALLLARRLFRPLTA